jgi:putative tryptophan/tyrosine transport system substrate-binding protein
MRRREFIAGLGAAACPLAVRAQQAERLRRIAILDAEGEAYAAFAEELGNAGWIEGRNLSTDRRFLDGASSGPVRAAAADMVSKSPEVIVCLGTLATSVFRQLTSTIPIVFVNVADPVAAGFVKSFAHPGGTITGFTSLEFSLAGKWLSLLKDIAPGITNVLVLYDRDNSNWEGYLQTLTAAAPVLGVDIRPASVPDLGEVERHIESFAPRPGAGLIVVPSGLLIGNREKIAALAARHRLPAMYPYKNFATAGGLSAYGSDTVDLYRRAAQYVDLILKGANPGDLPVQAPTKFELVINLRAAKAIGLVIGQSLLFLADEVIE